jgi:hypothetical protein
MRLYTRSVRRASGFVLAGHSAAPLCRVALENMQTVYAFGEKYCLIGSVHEIFQTFDSPSQGIRTPYRLQNCSTILRRRLSNSASAGTAM